MKSRYAYGSTRTDSRDTRRTCDRPVPGSYARNFVVTIAFSIGASRAPMPVRARHTIAIAYARFL